VVDASEEAREGGHHILLRVITKKSRNPSDVASRESL
jgi:hypothetical protein